MLKKLVKNIGWIFYFTDYVKIIRDDTGAIDYLTAPSKKNAKDYNERTIGILKTKAGEYIVGVAVSSPNKKNNDKSGRRVVSSRILNLYNNNLQLSDTEVGVTYVPEAHVDLLSEDQYTYQPLMGSIHPSFIKEAVKESCKADRTYLSTQMKIMFDERKKQLEYIPVRKNKEKKDD